MRLCKHLTCDRPADVFWHGAWCAAHALERFGRVPFEMAKLALETARREVALPIRRGPEGTGARNAVPVTRGASTSGSLDAAEPPAPLFTDDLVARLAERGWDEIDIELACITELDA
jgi:hypothetical protein